MRLRTLRKSAGLTQTELAHRLYIKQSAYSRYEKEQRQLPLDVLIRLAAFYHTSVDYLLELTDNPEPYPRT